MIALAALAEVLCARLAVVAVQVRSATTDDWHMATDAANARVRCAELAVVTVGLRGAGLYLVVAAAVVHAAVHGRGAAVRAVQVFGAAAWVAVEGLLVGQVFTDVANAGVEGARVAVVADLELPAWASGR